MSVNKQKAQDPQDLSSQMLAKRSNTTPPCSHRRCLEMM